MSNLIQVQSPNLQGPYTPLNTTPQLFKPVPIRKSSKDLSYPLQTKTNSPISSIVYPNFGFNSYSNFNLNTLGNLQSYLLSQEKNKKLDTKNKPCCNCIKTKCMKKYCECFANNKSCKNCICSDCKNKNKFEENNSVENKENIENNNNTAMNNNSNTTNSKEIKIVFCTCSKSGCNKKYCDCYKENQKCNIKCRCINCLNMEDHQDKCNNECDKGINLDETRCDSGKKSISGEINEFYIQKISVCIKKSQTYINIEKLSTDDFSLLCKKRKSEKI